MRPLDDIKRDEANATNGPWAVREDGHVHFVNGHGTVARDMAEWDAAFIAAARSDVPDLIALVERLRDALRKVEWGSDGWSESGKPHCPGCGNRDKSGHKSDCDISAALAAADGTDTQTARDDGQGGTP